MTAGRWRSRERGALPRLWAAAILVCLVAALGVAAAWSANDAEPPRSATGAALLEQPARSDAVSRSPRHEVVIHRPEGPPRLALDETDALGRPVSVACSTCHTIRDPDPANRATEQLDEFHQELAVAHGTLACLSCHNPRDYDTLRLADGRAVSFRDVMTLCAQCHGPQARDYENGAHGGMTGHWDLSRGPRTRNNCIDCHDPHAPAYPVMRPNFKPRDRFLTPAGSAVEPTHG